MTIRPYLAALGLLSAAPLAFAQNNGLPGPEQSVVLLETVTQRGEDCEILNPWQAAGLRAQIEVETRDWTGDRLDRVAAAAAERIGETGCDDEFLNTYLDAVRQNMETEILPPYLVAYRVFARMDEPPAVFTATALRLDHSDVLGAIDTKLAALEASGRPPEGGKPWPDFIARTETRIEEVTASLDDNSGGARYSADEAAALIAQTAMLTRLWYQVETAEEAPGEP